MPPAPMRIVYVPAPIWPMSDGGRRAGNAGHVVMLGEPVAAIAPALGVLRQVDRIPERLAAVPPSTIGARSSTDKGTVR